MSTHAAGDRIITRVARFGRVLHEAGVDVGPGRLQNAVLALTAVDIASREDVYWALRCSLVSRHEELPVFDSVFAGFEAPGVGGSPRPEGGGDDPEVSATTPSLVDAVQREAAEEEPAEDDDDDVGTQWSGIERLRGLDFARYTDEDLLQAARMVARLTRALPMRRSRRARVAKDGRVFDKRRTLRAAMRTDGYPVARLWRQPRLVPRKLLFIVDVSGSMQPYARVMVMFMQALVRAGRHVETFTLGTRLTRITPQLEQHDWNRALDDATQSVADWAGGTRIGEALHALNAEWAPKGVTSGAVVVIVSDGWECGDVAELAHEMARLRRSAHKIVWVNPLAGRPGYEPLSVGMAASLPFIDRFLPGHDLRALEGLAAVLETLPESRGRATPSRPAGARRP